MLHRTLIAAMVLSLFAIGSTQARKPPHQADPAYLATIVDDEVNPLPRGPALWERGGYPPPDPASPAPEGYVRAQSEYEYTRGIFIRWGAYNALHTSMVVPLTTATPPADIWIAVSGISQENSARSVLQGGGADMNHVHFIHASTDSVWIRDYGPRFIEHDGLPAIVDHRYNRMRPNDDAFPGVVASNWSEEHLEIGLVHGGGNFHLFRNRDAFMTRLVVNENQAYGISEADIIERYATHQGLNLTLTDPFPQSYDFTQHIDMWMLPLGDDKVLIGEYAANQGGGVPRQVTEDTAELMASRGYTVYRTPGWNTGGAHYTYANSVIVNQTVLVCQFSGYATENAQAVAVYEDAMPFHDIVPVDCSGIIGLSGAIHCIVKHVPEVVLFRDTFEGY